jgi:deferrochelatase/peroxidase EfeB
VSSVEYSDVQGLARFGYRELVEARYYLLTIRDAAAAAHWLAWAPLTTAEERKPPPDRALQVAFTCEGMRRMGVPKTVLRRFSTEFWQGMTEPSRSRRLGDINSNDPEWWSWGKAAKHPHLIVMIFATQGGLPAWEQSIQQHDWSEAFSRIETLDTSNMGLHEPFGFRDSITTPDFDWKREKRTGVFTLDYTNEVALGELLLGYPNEYNKYTDRALLSAGEDPGDHLLPAEDDPHKKDLGRNGTYLVLRQLEQDVRGFWRYLDAAAGGDAVERYRLGAAMVGRTVAGVPLMKPNSSDTENQFTYDSDPAGTQCPLGAHIRRANPRNADFIGRPGVVGRFFNRLAIPRPKMRQDLIASTRFHRLLRRGREYGPQLLPEAAVGSAPAADDAPCGLHFACLCANINRQFEFVQNAWLMSTKFNGLTEESDPLLGNRAALGDCPFTGNFSLPRDGRLARRLTGMPQFVTVRGGAYFFLPSLRARRYIVQTARESRPA